MSIIIQSSIYVSIRAPCIFRQMKKTPLAFLATALAAATALTAATALPAVAQAPAEDPFIWLEEAHSDRAMAWVEAENAKTSAGLESNPLFHTLFDDARVIAEAKDRIPEPT